MKEKIIGICKFIWSHHPQLKYNRIFGKHFQDNKVLDIVYTVCYSAVVIGGFTYLIVECILG